MARKRKRNNTQNTHRTTLRQDADEPCNISKSLDLPTPVQVKSCYQNFYNATSTSALKPTVCGVCAREVSARDDRPTLWHINELPNSHHLIPLSLHPAHDLF